MHAGKKAAAIAALEHVKPDTILGVGTGSTVNFFIQALADQGIRLEGAVSSSEASTKLLKKHGYEVLDLNMTGDLDLYVDGADEVNGKLQLIKGGGGALTREKIVAGASRRFICIADASKRVETLGTFPLPIEVIPMARSFVARQIVLMGADPEYREGPQTDNGNIILDCHGFSIDDPVKLETEINTLPGVVTNGLFAARPADEVIYGFDDGSLEQTSLAANR